MPNQYCTHCGASLVVGARFCVECGANVGGRASTARANRVSLDRYAPALVIGVVLLGGSAAVVLGTRQAKEPPRVPPRNAARAEAQLPQGHPPIALPEDVRAAIQRKAAEIEAQPDNADARKQLALMQYRAGLIDPAYLTDAVKTYEAILAKDPQDLDALRALGDIAVDGNQSAQAMAYYQRFLAIRPADPYVRTLVGNLQLSARNTAEALRSYEAALAADPMLFQAQLGLGFALAAAGEPAQAMDALKKARGLATDEATRAQVDELIARVTAPRSTAAPSDDGGSGGFRAGVESIFRTHPIVGAKIERIEWADAGTVKVVLREFPMEAMPPFAKEKFTERIKSGVRENKTRHHVDQALAVQLVDSASGRVMDTVTE
jgi:tetratricopeptide (TPR) repeat protein